MRKATGDSRFTLAESGTSGLAGQCQCPYSGYLCNPASSQQHRVDRKNSPEEEEAFQL